MSIFDSISSATSTLGNVQSATRSISDLASNVSSINSISSAVAQLGNVSGAISSINAIEEVIPGLGNVSRLARGLGDVQSSITSIQAIANNIPGFNSAVKVLGDALPSIPSLELFSPSLGSTVEHNDIMSKTVGFAKPTKYLVNMSINKAGNIPQFDKFVKETNFNCTSAVMPGESLATFDVRRGKPVQSKMPYDNIYSELRLIFRVSQDHKERILFESWYNYIYDKTTNTFAFPEQYYGTIDITQLSNDMKKVKTVRCYEAYPTTISSISLAYDANNVVETFDVLFAYTDWETI